MLLDLYPHKCKECGKRFEASREYRYKICERHMMWFCSYHCMRKHEKEKAG